jgi:MFS family permease
MLDVALVLFALLEYDSPGVAGAAAFLSSFPGLVAAPVVGALLDRYGRIRMICMNWVTIGACLGLISILSLASRLPSGLFLAIVLVFGATQMFSDAGLRSVLPQVTPGHLWERVNALDSSSYNVAFIIGPAVAAGLVGTAGGETAFLVVAALCVIAWFCLSGVQEPERPVDGTRGLGQQALDGLRYVWHHPTLRGLGISVSVSSIGFGMNTILVPVIIVEHLGAAEVNVGLVFTASGAAGVVAALYVGRMDTRGREWSLLVLALLGVGCALLLLFPAAGTAAASVGVAWVAVEMVVMGAASGVWDVALFTMRQRRTDPRLMARAISISMAFNWSGVPIGAALAGYLVDVSLVDAILVAVAAAAVGTGLGAVLVPRRDTAERLHHSA